MTQEHLETFLNDSLSEAAIVDYLYAHPSFFEDKPDLLGQMRLNHGCGEAVSLIERQVRLLREENHIVKRKITETITIAQDNEQLLLMVKRLMIRLLQTDSLSSVLEVIFDSLLNDFDVDAAKLFLFDSEEFCKNTDSVVRLNPEKLDPELESVLSHNTPLCGRLRDEQLRYLFGEGGDGMGSCAIVPLGDQTAYGILAIGSFDPNYFKEDLGTFFLTMVGDVLAQVLPKYLPANPQS